MRRRYTRTLLCALGITPLIAAIAQQPQQPQGPMSEQVFKNIKVFNGVPASDLIPSMEFMAASLGYECTSCHDPKDYAADIPAKETARHMILMQRDINAKNFNNRLVVTCMTCHGGHENPVPTPVPAGVSLRHERFEGGPRPAELFSKYLAAVGDSSAPLVRTGTLTAPNDVTHKVESTPLEFIQAPGGKFRLVSGDRKVVSNGKDVWYGPQQMFEEGLFIFQRVGRAWRGTDAFTGLDRPTIAGREVNGKQESIVVRSPRSATSSTEELYFDAKTGLLTRFVNIRRSTLGAVVSSFDYSDYRKVDGVQVPMKVTVTFPGDHRWMMEFKSAKVDPKLSDATFAGGS